MKHLAQDVRYGLRLLKKNLTFTVATVSVLALCICATATIFIIVNAVILSPLPYQHPERLVALSGTQARADDVPISPADFLDLKAQAQAFDEMAAYNVQSLNLTSAGEPERVEAAIVSPGFFRVLEIKPLHGRTFTPEDDQAGGVRMAVLSKGFWQRRMGGAAGVVGTEITLNNETFRVVGVMTERFQFPERTDVWLSPRRTVPEPPIVINADISHLRGVRYLGAVGRLKPGVSTEQAGAELASVSGRLAQQFPDTNEGHGVRVVPLHEQLVGDIRVAIYSLFGAAILVLLIACSNVANLLLSRAIARGREVNIRMALGATRRRITQQLLTESVLLALAGGALGLLLANWSIDALMAISPFKTSLLSHAGLDLKVVVFTLLVSLLIGVGFGLVPVRQTRRVDIAGTLREGERGSTSGPARHRFRNALVVAQIMLSVALLNSAGLMLKSFYRLQQVDLGFRPENILTMQISLPRSLYIKPGQVTAFYDQTLQRLKELPGVKGVGAISKLPLSGPGVSGGFVVEGRPQPPGEQLRADRRITSPDYFRVMSIPLSSGRFFTDADVDRPGVALINQSAARRFWPGEDPVGKRISIDPDARLWLEVVGVVGDVRHSNLYAEPMPEIYFPYFQNAWHNMTVVAKLDPAALNSGPDFRRAVLTVDKSQPVYNIKTMSQLVDELLAQPRFNVILLSVFATMALLLAVIGLYGVMANFVIERTHEIGIRMALGARPRDIIKMILSRAAFMVLVGLGAGLYLSYAFSQSLSSLLFAVSTLDAGTYATVSAFFALTMLTAVLAPAYRASRLSPTIAIRQE